MELCACIIYIYSHMYFNKHWLKASTVQDVRISHVSEKRGVYEDE